MIQRESLRALVSGRSAVYAFMAAMLAGFLLHDLLEEKQSAQAR